MKVVFTPIENIIPSNLTIGKIYEVVDLLGTNQDRQNSPTKDYYLLKNDDGHHYTYWIGNFTELEKYRKVQIDKIIL
jgi:hypothetical protein